jgi:hypothetical protein
MDYDLEEASSSVNDFDQGSKPRYAGSNQMKPSAIEKKQLQQINAYQKNKSARLN